MEVVLPKKTLLIVPMITFMVLDQVAQGDGSSGPFLCSNPTHCGEPLFLTRLFNKSNILEAQRAAMVQFPDAPEFKQVRHIRSYSGFLTVNETFDSNVFFWFFPAETNSNGSPLLLWLEGGPGDASITDVFSSSGPLQIGDDLHLSPGSDRWTKGMNVLYLDSPAGAGFSSTKNASGYATNQKDYARDLYAALSQFYLLFPDHRSNDLFIAGISYAGKYIPALAYEIHEKNPSTPNPINLKGIAIGSGFVDPLIQVGYSKFLYGVSVIDSETKVQFENIENGIRALILNEQYIAASKKLNEYLMGGNGTKSVIANVTGVANYNFLIPEDGEGSDSKIWMRKFGKMIVKPELRNSIHVGGREFWPEDPKYNDHLPAGVVQSVVDKMEVLMDNYRVVLYGGQLDVMCNYRLMVDYILKLKWAGADEYVNATRRQWWVEGELAGYSKTAGNFTEILVRDAGHRTHEDKPSWIFDLLKKVSYSIPFY